MSNPSSFLPRAISMLARLDYEGQLEDYLTDVAEANRGPANDLDRYPHHRYQVGRFARLASTLFCVPIGVAHEAACDALLPSTRRGNNLAILEEYEARLEQAAATAAAQRKLSAVSRRRVG